MSDHQQPKSQRAGLGWCVASVPFPSGPNTGSNPGGGPVLNKKNKIKKGHQPHGILKKTTLDEVRKHC